MKNQKVLKVKEHNRNEVLLKLGNGIREAREKKHISQVTLTLMLYDYGFKVSKDTIISYELGRVNIPSATLFIITTILDMDLTALMKDLGKTLNKIDM